MGALIDRDFFCFEFWFILALPRGLGDEFGQLLLHFLGFALGAGDLGFAVLPDAHDAVELFPAFAAEIQISGHAQLLALG
jgi:hypothetical protein